ncbi:MAG: DUF4349 domain-containing protein [Lentisphaerae bacterium]|nr:DUF4349 domain-containing protein [Lentisphaerota bacterium]
MNTHVVRGLALGLLVLTSGCMAGKAKSSSLSGPTGYGMPPMQAAVRAGDLAETAPRMLAWTAYLNVDVWNISNAVAAATDFATQAGGYIEHNRDQGDSDASLRLRVPAAAFTNAVGALEGLGHVTSRSVQGEDVTEQVVDNDARLKNKLVLRDRLQHLLDKATDVKDILAIETELNRLQGDIESMEARAKALKGQVDFAAIELSLHRRKVLGPLGYVFKGLFWTVGKLFVIRD